MPVAPCRVVGRDFPLEIARAEAFFLRKKLFYMDRVSWIGLVICFIGLVLWVQYSEQKWGSGARARQLAAYSTNSPSTNAFAGTPGYTGGGATNGVPSYSGAPSTVPAGTPTIGPATGPGRRTMNMPEGSAAEARIDLKNEEVRATITSWGGGIASVELLKQKDTKTTNVVMNRHGQEPVLNLSGYFGPYERVSYELVKDTGTSATFTHKTADGLAITREFTLLPGYVIALKQTLTNSTDKPLNLPSARMNVGVAGPLHQHDGDLYTGAAWLNPPAVYHHNGVFSFMAGSFLGFTYSAARDTIPSAEGVPVLWAAVKNQFFAIIVAAPQDAPFVRAATHPVSVPGWTTASAKGISAEVWTQPRTLAPGESATAEYTVYCGPKEEPLLARLPSHQDLVMEYGWTGIIVRPLQWLMRQLHSLVGNWGLAIILLTFIVKAVFWPLQTAANTSMKKMQALAPKLKELQEKHKDQPEKLNSEMMKMYRDYGVNPVAGCLPLLIQMPVFIGLYFMLQGATELRGASFLWAADLTQPDTIYTLHFLGMGLDVNPLPLLMAATQVVLMRMTPMSGDQAQAVMMQIMPVVLLVFMYYFASGLALYWTVNNIISAVQTYINLRKPVPVLKRVPKTAMPGTGGGGGGKR
ncbi:preprotein translocase YidC [Verrucomicrobia bacterium LW23]|nr:preprotein translocase YidC [Verrucomicrobia bacterium LW23]